MTPTSDFTLFWSACILGLSGLAAEGISSFRFIQGLKRHPRMRAYFGHPTIWSEADFISAWPTIRRLYRKSYRSVADAGGIAFCGKSRTAMILSYGYGGMSVLAALVLVILQGPVYLGELLP
jgi:hypothetical protein